MELIFASIKDAIRLRLYLSAHGLQNSISETNGQFMYTFQPHQLNKDRYVKALTHFIKEVKRNEWIDHRLMNVYHYENEDERAQIMNIAYDMFTGKRRDLVDYAGKIKEETLIKTAVQDLLNYKGSVLLDSFTRFRLKHYFEQVKKYVDIAIDEYKMEQEYQMFINMLRNYLKEREPRLKTVHLQLDNISKFYDENVLEMENGDIRQMVDQRLLANHPVYVDSTIIAPLLSIAPEKIYLYTNEEEQPLVRTLNNIFEERISILPPAHLHTLKK